MDDDADMVAFLGLLLQREGMKVETASDGDAALAHVSATPPDLVLLDVMMPGASGFEVCRQLKSDEATALIPVVLVTSLEDSDSRVRGIEAGADDFLSKPVKREELLARVKTLRRLHETRKELESRRLAAEVQRKDAIRKAFSRYISPRLADRIADAAGDQGDPFQGRAQRTNLVALFADLRGFTRLTEKNEVGAVVGMLNEYFAVLTDAAYQHDGTIFNMAGDSLLVGFNVPFPQPDAAERAWRTALEMVGRFAPVAAAWHRRHGLDLGVGVGICTGEAIIGNVGSEHYANYTIIGNPVNTAARLMQMAAAGEVLVCGPVYERIRRLLSGYSVTERGDVALRGRSEPIAVFAVQASTEASA
ncbi:MAG: response regulator [Betaproteobacteria bacterium]|nr:response regulator [Betaproteobacteria bacterium]